MSFEIYILVNHLLVSVDLRVNDGFMFLLLLFQTHFSKTFYVI